MIDHIIFLIEPFLQEVSWSTGKRAPAAGQINDAKHATDFSVAHFRRRRRFLIMAKGASGGAQFFPRHRENYVPRAGSARCKLFYSRLQIRSRWLVITVMKGGRRCERRAGDKVYGETTQTRNNLAPVEPTHSREIIQQTRCWLACGRLLSLAFCACAPCMCVSVTPLRPEQINM